MPIFLKSTKIIKTGIFLNRLANNESSTNFNDLITDLNNLLYGDGSDESEPEEVPEIEE